LFAHDLFGKPLHTFPDHALAAISSARPRTQPYRVPGEPLIKTVVAEKLVPASVSTLHFLERLLLTTFQFSVVSQLEVAIASRFFASYGCMGMRSSDFFFGLSLIACAIGLVVLGWIFVLSDGVVIAASVLVGVGTLGLMAVFSAIAILCAIWGYRR
jgi:hypothetical protein